MRLLNMVCAVAVWGSTATTPSSHSTAKSLALAGRPLEAVQVLRDAVEADPGDSFAYANLGALLSRAGELDDSVLPPPPPPDCSVSDAHRRQRRSEPRWP